MAVPAQPSVLIVSPYSGLPGHHWRYAEHLAQAYRSLGVEAKLLINEEPPAGISEEIKPHVHIADPKVQDALQALRQNSVYPHTATYLRRVTAAVLQWLTPERQQSYQGLHFIDATALLSLHWLLTRCQRPAVFNLMSGPEPFAIRWGNLH